MFNISKIQIESNSQLFRNFCLMQTELCSIFQRYKSKAIHNRPIALVSRLGLCSIFQRYKSKAIHNPARANYPTKMLCSIFIHVLFISKAFMIFAMLQFKDTNRIGSLQFKDSNRKVIK